MEYTSLAGLIIELREVQGQTWPQIGELLNRDPEAVRSLYRREKDNVFVPDVSTEAQDIHITNGTARIAFPTDEHYPYQDEQARSIALQIVADFNPNVMVSGSDGVDFYKLSKFDKNPDRQHSVQHEIDLWIRGQDEWRSAAPDARRIFIVGNHEDRLRRYLWSNPELHSLRAVRLPNLLELDKQQIEYSPREIVFFDKLVIRHGAVIRKYSAYTAKAELEKEKFAISVLSGHTHRGGSFFTSNRNGTIQAHECFCLCDLEPEYADRPDWQQGIVLATVSNQVLNIEPILFHTRNGKKVAFWRDKMYTSN